MGTEIDAAALVRLFDYLGFSIHIHENLKGIEFRKRLKVMMHDSCCGFLVSYLFSCIYIIIGSG